MLKRRAALVSLVLLLFMWSAIRLFSGTLQHAKIAKEMKSEASQANWPINVLGSVTKQLSVCWKFAHGSPPSMGPIEIDLTMKPDKTVAGYKIVDQSRYLSDRSFHLAADKLVRAVYDPRCNPLTSLPSGEFEKWSDLDLTFDPRYKFEY